MKNKLTDLADHLFAQLERLSEEKMPPEKLHAEIARTGAITAVAREIVATGRLAVDAQRTLSDLPQGTRPPALLGLDRVNGSA